MKKRKYFTASTGARFIPATFKNHPFYQPPISGETRDQATNRRETNPVQWTEHQPTYFGCLGPNFEEVMHEIIEAEMLQIHNDHSDSKQHIEEFLEKESDLRKHYWQRLKDAERVIKQYRHSHEQSPFDWSRESVESLKSMLGASGGKAKTPRTIEQRQKFIFKQYLADLEKGNSLETALKDRDLAKMQRLFKTKPEYSGKNHPLELNQIIRKPK